MAEVIEHQISERIADGASELLAEGRVRLMTLRDPDLGLLSGAIVLGKGNDYQVVLGPHGVQCDCMAAADHGWGVPRCKHVVATMVAWREAIEGHAIWPNGYAGL